MELNQIINKVHIKTPQYILIVVPGNIIMEKGSFWQTMKIVERNMPLGKVPARTDN